MLSRFSRFTATARESQLSRHGLRVETRRLSGNLDRGGNGTFSLVFSYLYEGPREILSFLRYFPLFSSVSERFTSILRSLSFPLFSLGPFPRSQKAVCRIYKILLTTPKSLLYYTRCSSIQNINTSQMHTPKSNFIILKSFLVQKRAQSSP